MPTSPENQLQIKQEEIICYCTGTTKEKIAQLMHSENADLDKIISKTGATTGCGSCDVSIVNFIMEQT